MPWIPAPDVFAAPPRVRPVQGTQPWAGWADTDDGLARISDSQLDGAALDLSAFDELAVRDSIVTGAALSPGTDTIVELERSELHNCDLSRTRFVTLRSSVVANCKLVGADLSGADVQDVVFRGCLFRYANLRSARLIRVRFENCTLDDVDFFDSSLEDVDFAESSLTAVNVDRLRASRVDLRGASSLGLDSVGRLDGCLVTESQLMALVYPLAFAAGLGVEARDDQANDNAGHEVD